MNELASMPFLSLLIFFSVSLASSYLFHLLKVPAGAILGPIFCFIALQFFGYRAVIPPDAKTVISSIFGVYFALKVHGLMKLQKNTFLMPIVITVLWFIGITFISSTVLRQLTSIDPTNAYLSVIPGGIAEINLISMSYEANLSFINTFQIIRLFSVIIFIPILFNIISKGEGQKPKKSAGFFFYRGDNMRDSIASFPVFLVGGTGSLILLWLNFPAAGLMGALFSVLLFQRISKRSYKPPQNIYLLILSFLGGTIGLNMDIGVFQSLSRILVPVLIITALTVGGAFLMAYVIHFFCKRDYFSTLLGVMPGGLVVMLSIAESATCDTFYVTSLQTIRLLTAVVLIPNLLYLLGLI